MNTEFIWVCKGSIGVYKGLCLGFAYESTVQYLRQGIELKKP